MISSNETVRAAPGGRRSTGVASTAHASEAQDARMARFSDSVRSGSSGPRPCARFQFAKMQPELATSFPCSFSIRKNATRTCSSHVLARALLEQGISRAASSHRYAQVRSDKSRRSSGDKVRRCHFQFAKTQPELASSLSCSFSIRKNTTPTSIYDLLRVGTSNGEPRHIATLRFVLTI